MHDAQNLYDPKSSSYGAIWDVQGGAVTGLGGDFAIVVGIDHGKEHRFDEYSPPWVNSKLLLTMNRFKDLEGHLGGQGSMYGSYIVNTLKPFIDRTYRTLTGVDNTAIIGSSMGAYISLYIGIEYPHVFGKIGAFSTAAWFNKEALFEHVVKVQKHQCIYMDIGSNETSDPTYDDFNQLYVGDSNVLYEVLLSSGMAKSQLRYDVYEGAIHNENEWKERLPDALRWLFDIGK